MPHYVLRLADWYERPDADRLVTLLHEVVRTRQPSMSTCVSMVCEFAEALKERGMEPLRPDIMAQLVRVTCDVSAQYGMDQEEAVGVLTGRVKCGCGFCERCHETLRAQ
jgi:hypothetical protein